MATAYGDQCVVAGAVATQEGSPDAQQLAPVAAAPAAEQASIADSEVDDTAANAVLAASSHPHLERRRENTAFNVKSGTVPLSLQAAYNAQRLCVCGNSGTSTCMHWVL